MGLLTYLLPLKVTSVDKKLKKIMAAQRRYKREVETLPTKTRLAQGSQQMRV